MAEECVYSSHRSMADMLEEVASRGCARVLTLVAWFSESLSGGGLADCSGRLETKGADKVTARSNRVDESRLVTTASFEISGPGC